MNKYFKTSIEKNGISHIILNRKPVNAHSYDFLLELNNTIAVKHKKGTLLKYFNKCCITPPKIIAIIKISRGIIPLSHIKKIGYFT